MEKCEKFCQSCLMPLENFKASGTNYDGTKNSNFCYLCFQNGKYTKENITFEQMLNICIKAIEQNEKMGNLKKWFLIKSYPKMLLKTKRWNQNK